MQVPCLILMHHAMQFRLLLSTRAEDHVHHDDSGVWDRRDHRLPLGQVQRQTLSPISRVHLLADGTEW